MWFFYLALAAVFLIRQVPASPTPVLYEAPLPGASLISLIYFCPRDTHSTRTPNDEPATHSLLRVIRTEDTAIPGSPISQAIISGDYLYISGFLLLGSHHKRGISLE
ncbi:hypothetical protein Hypma_005659 [Hypsizygus marmoreus]|uniref:Uncharacterized protein n=1 Tax=Hypsizygus marmoreus TaxID=39966 RepID=A0A369JZ12_HYPMA|nr:hypothetical protein Hypma_005659 [Hypsizygus marmoreus]